MTKVSKKFKTLNATMRLSVFLAIIAIMPACDSNRKQEKHKADPDCVYVCTGSGAKRYHSVDNCKGLSKCSHSIVEMTIEEAEAEGKTPCRLCVE